jgi:4-amino-4-deoxychorismate lyase
MCLFIESIRVEHRRLMHLEWHERRMQQTLFHHYGLNPEVNLSTAIQLPDELDGRVYKCRVEYGTSIEHISFTLYEPKQVKTLRLVNDDAIEYAFKYTDRSAIEALLEQRMGADDILIVRQGCLTDTSFSNIALLREGEWYTPDTFLLNGTCRQRLLAEGVIREARITVNDLEHYSEIRLINALLDWEKLSSVSILRNV